MTFIRSGKGKEFSLYGLLAAFIMLSAPARADMIVTDLRARPSLGAAHNSIVWMTLRNTSSEPDRLLRAESTIADRAGLHVHVKERRDGRTIMRMRPVPYVAIPAKGEIRLEPGGLHVMLIGVHRPLHPGDRFPLRLIFEHASPKEVTVPVLKLSETMSRHGRGRTHGQVPPRVTGN